MYFDLLFYYIKLLIMLLLFLFFLFLFNRLISLRKLIKGFVIPYYTSNQTKEI